jgi:hypothetical protein
MTFSSRPCLIKLATLNYLLYKYNNKTCCLNGVRFLSNLFMSKVTFLNSTKVWLIRIGKADQEIWGEEPSSK